MKIIEFSYPNIPTGYDNLALCLGYFDGIHLGHQKIINSAIKQGFNVGVLTFDNSPAFVLGKIKVNNCLTSISDKAEILEKMKVDYLFLMHFDKESALIDKDEFINEILKKFNPKKLFCGEDYTFGIFGEGKPDYLSKFFDLQLFELEKVDGIKISSRDIVKLIQEGNIKKANELLNRPYRINGLVVEGNKFGRQIDFPTANLLLDYSYTLPKSGVYEGRVSIYDKTYKGLINIGVHPTINELNSPIIEVHLINFTGNLYGKDIFVEFLSFLREEIKFQNVEQLKIQIEKDKQQILNNKHKKI